MVEFSEEQINQMREDLKMNFLARDRFINKVKEQFIKQGRDFDKEFSEWKKNKD
jgi:hypothetical protein